MGVRKQSSVEISSAKQHRKRIRHWFKHAVVLVTSLSTVLMGSGCSLGIGGEEPSNEKKIVVERLPSPLRISPDSMMFCFENFDYEPSVTVTINSKNVPTEVEQDSLGIFRGISRFDITPSDTDEVSVRITADEVIKDTTFMSFDYDSVVMSDTVSVGLESVVYLAGYPYKLRLDAVDTVNQQASFTLLNHADIVINSFTVNINEPKLFHSDYTTGNQYVIIVGSIAEDEVSCVIKEQVD